MKSFLELSTRDVIIAYTVLFDKQEMDPDVYSLFLRLQTHLFDHLTLEEIQSLKTDLPKVIRRFP